MRLKGEMVIELTDTNTGAVETAQETNMITEAVNNILGLNPMGIYLKASGEYDNSVLWNGELLPICPNMIGGILLFPAVLEEKADHIYEQGKNLPVAYAKLTKEMADTFVDSIIIHGKYDYEIKLVYDDQFADLQKLKKEKEAQSR